MSTILIVDDSPTVLMSMEQLLSRFGYGVMKAASAEEALRSVSGGSRPNLVITDFNMPGKNGAELIRALRAMAQHRFTPMLVLTTESQRDRREEAKAAGATGWLVKPADPVQLESVLKKLLPNG
ncbi:response regulator [Pseudooceanicola sp. CBS1P-1]|uniref:Response regulator n=1 Tax=Pseudooceanicola albus TaxID=2692189 RepID=A0A6L7G7J6_9RHOB|nr:MULTISPECIES: response regulator [Pseudooceanicola]MBT9382852.1 response regulator [Pseudooceanicola endophyticus]MXN20224.1 response regulator [Pseudooceanicola albus]